MNQKKYRWTGLLLAALTTLTLFAGCAGDANSGADTSSDVSAAEDGADASAAISKEDASSESAGEDHTATAEDTGDANAPTDEFTYVISVSIDENFISDYSESPAYQYWVRNPFTVDGEKRRLSIEFWAAPSGSESDYLNNLLATAEYPDIINTSYSSMKAVEMYEEGIAIDITDYVEKFMPNYLAWIEKNNYYDYLTNDIDGERRFIQIYDVNDKVGNMWGGWEYRRDWIVKYGKKDDGSSFSGEWADGSWEDDVVFPSGNADPIYISDWEWMLDIFETALEEEGIEDGYCMSLASPGAFLTGEFISGFGGAPMWYINADGKCAFGASEDHTKAYIECMNNWWNKGWIDPYFDEHTNDMFFSVDSASVYSGKVGAFYGLNSQLEASMDSGNNEYTNGIVVFGAPQPINDLYGTAADQGKPSTLYFCPELANVSTIVVTNKTEGKNLATFFTALDTLYTPDGSMLREYGLSKEQQAEVQDPLYNEWGLEDGTYEKVINEDGTYTYVINPNRDNIDGVAGAASMFRVIGMTPNENIDHGYTKSKAHSIANWTMYPCSGMVPSAVSNQLNLDQSNEFSRIQNDTITYISQNLPLFIRGELTLENDWGGYAAGFDNLGCERYCEYINEILGK